ncbi:MBOAT family O-acyltransferase [Flagellimonas pelagia]|uniref:MBOAT family protein n=1 Tax=Flagellimonas pelagia TaxID=2306998 RepID=A0A3A1NFC2_9FLAO|nr:MBOAT family O-acyltransferase [Allomuricauda maritima]RIV42157.1 MBOAT family protein [Allomuricauda maritima]TXJ91045.1 MBOAT family protein [Allomuricauda maritima]
MLFNSVEYLIFLPIVFFAYWAIGKFGNLKSQNGLLLIASYFFYGLWDWRFLFLILASTVVDYLVGLAIHQKQSQQKKGKLLLWCSIVFNISLLGFFKYYNFFVESFIDMVSLFGYTIKSTWTLKIILPVGISFYTFQTMSYSLDIYYKRIKPTRSFLNFATFVAFFPQLVAGPIERASNLLGQITNKRSFNYLQATEGLKLVLWGLFKKMVIADGIAPIVDDIFANYDNFSASTLIMGVTFFSFQVYGDFSGYSDIAIGTSKLFGIELMSNFKFPNFSRNVAEYWQRWHVSLSTWFRHYLYIPLGGSRGSKLQSIRNISIIFLVSGFWHGANWTFIFWGGFHALAYIPVFLMGRNTIYKDSVVAQNTFLPTFKEMGQLILTFAIVTFSRIFFRSESLQNSFAFIKRLFTQFHWEEYHHPMGYRMIDYFVLLVLFVVYEYIIRKDERSPFKFKYRAVRFCVYTLVVFCILLFYDDGVDRSFIYFQF